MITPSHSCIFELYASLFLESWFLKSCLFHLKVILCLFGPMIMMCDHMFQWNDTGHNTNTQIHCWVCAEQVPTLKFWNIICQWNTTFQGSQQIDSCVWIKNSVSSQSGGYVSVQVQGDVDFSNYSRKRYEQSWLLKSYYLFNGTFKWKTVTCKLQYEQINKESEFEGYTSWICFV